MTIRTIFTSGVILLGLSSAIRVEYDVAQPPDNLAPLVGKNQPVDWFFVFKFNSESFPGCDNPPVVGSAGIFGGNVFAYAQGKSQQYLVASSEHPMLEKQSICLGATDNDPLGSTFAQVYLTNKYNYVIWNDQFYSDPQEFGLSRSAPWAHSKGMLAWDTKGSGFVLQVTTPSWPAAGSAASVASDAAAILPRIERIMVLLPFCLRPLG